MEAQGGTVAQVRPGNSLEGKGLILQEVAEVGAGLEGAAQVLRVLRDQNLGVGEGLWQAEVLSH